jgi:ABC-type bacteriocin/lantibiotic exporter with double-glycine peptidase domain
MADLSRQTHWSQGAFMSFLNFMGNASLLAVLSTGGVLISKKKLTVGQLARFTLLSGFVGLGFSGRARINSSPEQSQLNPNLSQFNPN